MAKSSHVQMSPEAVEVARRSQTAGMRAFVYGTVLALSGVAVGTTVGAHVMEVRSAEDVRMLAKAAFEPAALALRQRFAPLKDWSQEVMGREGGAEARLPQERFTQSALSQRISSRLGVNRSTGTHGL
mmetsp:Transcript_14267/g.43095  ORF Transcript_14267/g.43095 Transcript_14267/m.43095 type:complete len:128 (-) Transcript_14267:485-868(-)